jgi:hypothetical protein
MRYRFQEDPDDDLYEDDDAFNDDDDQPEFGEPDEKTLRLQRYGELNNTLDEKRTTFAGIGTNKAKRRLNNLAKVSPLARGIRLALEIEDKNIRAKQAYGKYRKAIYQQKHELLLDLITLCKDMGWRFGAHASTVPCVTHVVYCDLPNTAQLSWHDTFTKAFADTLPVYDGQWDGVRNSTLAKLEASAAILLNARVAQANATVSSGGDPEVDCVGTTASEESQ